MMRQRGFSLIELSVAVALLGVLVSAVYSVLGPQLKWKARGDTELRMQSLKLALESAYRQNLLAIDADAGARLNLGALGVINPINPNGQRQCVAVAGVLNPVAVWLRSSPDEAIRDGYGRDYCILINARTPLPFNGQNLPYHPVAIVSGGRDAQVNAGTSLVGGRLVLAGDDAGVVVDTAGVAASAYLRTMDRLARATTAFEQYFTARSQGDAARTPSTDYFGCGGAQCPQVAAANWDAAGRVPLTCALPLAMNAVTQFVGLTNADITDGYGQFLRYDNCGGMARNPANANVNMQFPPYTLVVQTTLPDGTVLFSTAVGKSY